MTGELSDPQLKRSIFVKPMSRALAAALLILIGLLGDGAPSWAQSYIEPPCGSGPVPAFEDHLQSLWYRRFWTGQCTDLPVFGCRRGSPYWNDVVRTITARAPAGERSEATTRVCRLGRTIGFEWTRPRAERRIDTHDLSAFNAALEKEPDVMAGLGAVEAQVHEKLR